MIWFGSVLWYINHCRLFNATSSLYIYIKSIGFALVGFYGISTIVGYLMPNLLHTYKPYMICKYKSTKLYGSNYYYVSLTIQLNISHWFTHS